MEQLGAKVSLQKIEHMNKKKKMLGIQGGLAAPGDSDDDAEARKDDEDAEDQVEEGKQEKEDSLE